MKLQITMFLVLERLTDTASHRISGFLRGHERLKSNWSQLKATKFKYLRLLEKAGTLQMIALRALERLQILELTACGNSAAGQLNTVRSVIVAMGSTRIGSKLERLSTLTKTLPIFVFFRLSGVRQMHMMQPKNWGPFRPLLGTNLLWDALGPRICHDPLLRNACTIVIAKGGAAPPPTPCLFIMQAAACEETPSYGVLIFVHVLQTGGCALPNPPAIL